MQSSSSLDRLYFGSIDADPYQAGHQYFKVTLCSAESDLNNAWTGFTGEIVILAGNTSYQTYSWRIYFDFDGNRQADGKIQFDDLSHSYTNPSEVAALFVLNQAPLAGSDVTTSVLESVAPGVTLATASATDPDANTTLTYTITGGDPSGLFAINSTTGAISLASGKHLDYETTTQHVLTVSASDGSLSAIQAVTINVGNVNETPGVLLAASITNSATQFFWSSAVGGNDHIYEFINSDVTWDAARAMAASQAIADETGYLVSVNTQAEFDFVTSHMNLISVGWNARTIWVGASDATTEGTFRWVDGPEAGTEFIETDWGWPNGYSGWTAGDDYLCIDFAASHYYFLTLDQEWFAGGMRTNQNSSAYSRTYAGNGYVIEYGGIPVPNAAPLAGSDVTTSVLESVAPGVTLATASATDPDANTTLTYKITGGDPNGIFAIDSTTGAISVASGKHLDYETTIQHILTVSASDGALFATQAVTIDVGNVYVHTAVSHTLTDTEMTLTLTGSDPTSGWGNTFANILTGNSEANALYGLGGDDTLDGGAGNDSMVGGTGDDTYVVDSLGDTVTENVRVRTRSRFIART